ncbi:antitoxin Xre/MbcA/ParS toxin-binding domain-containing protein [Undibacterium sp. SXout7W]|uniref:antitoxin Xre/MbcA/ParS toxin-binding domain-containing protein n=1 Tax=Undibacterium sp. SXout7W TaxID=3413049 RepID=UPI003BF20E5A
MQILFPDPNQADEWINRANAHELFAGKPALSRLLSGDLADLLLVRQYLDTQCDAEYEKR